jgi:hypothetical protein
MLIDLLRELPIAFWLLLGLVVGLPTWGWYMSTLRKCPLCRCHALKWIDQGVFYDPDPRRSLHRCRNCGAEFLRCRWHWLSREEWTREWGEDIWDNFPDA